jgi:hypothetical protein
LSVDERRLAGRDQLPDDGMPGQLPSDQELPGGPGVGEQQQLVVQVADEAI